MSLSKISLPEFSGKGVLITGASTGIGAELARAFAAQGAKVGLHYNSSKDAAEGHCQRKNNYLPKREFGI